MAAPVAVITATGIVAPTYAECLSYYQDQFRAIYGADIVISPDSQDGQLIAIYAQSLYDTNQLAVAIYNSFSPATAQGAGLSTVIKINGLTRLVASRSSTPVTLVGQIGTIITNGLIGDNLNLGTKWTLPATVTIGGGGTVTVTATCTEDGATEAAAHSLTEILTPTRGWQTVDNPSAAAPGAPVESDATLRLRQSSSTSLPAESVLDSIYGSVANVPGVTRLEIYENDGDTADADGIPAHSISAVIEGGDADVIAETIALKKTPGTGTYGTTEIVVIDPRGMPNTISFYVLAVIQLDVVIAITALGGYTSSTATLIKAAVAEYVSTLSVGEDSYYGRLWAPADLSGASAVTASGLSQSQLAVLSNTYKVTAVTQAIHAGMQAAADVAIAFNQAAAAVVANITVNVT